MQLKNLVISTISNPTLVLITTNVKLQSFQKLQNILKLVSFDYKKKSNLYCYNKTGT